jgi:hypothetical protein
MVVRGSVRDLSASRGQRRIYYYTILQLKRPKCYRRSDPPLLQTARTRRFLIFSLTPSRPRLPPVPPPDPNAHAAGPQRARRVPRPALAPPHAASLFLRSPPPPPRRLRPLPPHAATPTGSPIAPPPPTLPPPNRSPPDHHHPTVPPVHSRYLHSRRPSSLAVTGVERDR